MTARILAPIVTLAMLSACSGISVSVDFDPEEDFSAFRTFGWVPMPQPKTGDFRIDNPLLDTRIRNAVENELIGRGFVLVSDRLPDFYVAYHLSLKQKLDVYTINRYYSDFYWTYSVPETRVNQYEQGTLVIDIADARENELVWRGIGVGAVRDHPTPEQTTREVNETVAAILKDFPPGVEARKDATASR